MNSNCCNAPIIENTDICSDCKEHCEIDKKEVFIEIAPKATPRPRFSKYGTYNKKEYTEYKEVIRLAYVAKNKGYPSENALQMRIDFFFKVPKSWTKKKKESAKWHISKPDTDNLIKAIKDALNGVAYKDDSQVCIVYASKRYSQRQGIKIEIEEID